jgi:hypothetical protein
MPCRSGSPQGVRDATAALDGAAVVVFAAAAGFCPATDTDGSNASAIAAAHAFNTVRDFDLIRNLLTNFADPVL